MDNRALGDRQLIFWILQMPDMEEVIPQIKLWVNPQVSLSQSHEGRYMKDPREGQMVQLKTIML
jgi:hypothetical protein